MGRAPESEVLALGAVGAFLVLANAVGDLALGLVYAPLSAGADPVISGVFGVILAIIMMACVGMYGAQDDPDEQKGWGTALAIFAAFSLWTGGGFLAGFVLAFTGGILAVILVHVHEAPLVDHRTGPSSSKPPPSGGGPAPPPTGWACPKCGWKNPADTPLCEQCRTSRDWWSGTGR